MAAKMAIKKLRENNELQENLISSPDTTPTVQEEES